MVAATEGSVVAESLESLTLEESPDFPFSDHIEAEDLRQIVDHCPRLLRIDVPIAYLNVDSFDHEGTNDINAVLSRRFKDATEAPKSGLMMDEVGCFITEPKENAGVGLKRSFRYNGDT